MVNYDELRRGDIVKVVKQSDGGPVAGTFLRVVERHRDGITAEDKSHRKHSFSFLSGLESLRKTRHKGEFPTSTTSTGSAADLL